MQGQPSAAHAAEPRPWGLRSKAEATPPQELAALGKEAHPGGEQVAKPAILGRVCCQCQHSVLLHPTCVASVPFNLQFVLPPELDQMVKSYVHGYRQLLAGTGVQALFVANNGQPFTSSSFCAYWKGLLQAADAAAIFPPRLLRHVFVS